MRSSPMAVVPGLPLTGRSSRAAVDRRLLVAIRLIAVVGLSAAAYLTYIKVADIAPICSTGGCEAVLTSQWAEVFGVPVPIVGTVTYVLLIGSTLVAGQAGRIIGLWLATAGALFSLFLQYQAIIVLGHFCPWCFTSACCMTTLAALTTWRFLRDA